MRAGDYADLALFFGTIVGIICIAVIIYLFERLSGCWHKWGMWRVDDTDESYAQFRQCTKCGYTEREQWKKLK